VTFEDGVRIEETPQRCCMAFITVKK